MFSSMVITKERMEQQCKATTAAELDKLHKAIADTPNLVRRMQPSTITVPSSSESESSDNEPPMTRARAKNPSYQASLLTVIDNNTRLQDRVAVLSRKAATYKSSRDETEYRYEQIRIDNTNLRVELSDAQLRIAQLRKISSAFVALLVGFLSLTVALISH